MDRLSETVRRMEARSALLKCGIAQRLARAEGEAGANQALRDQLGMTTHQARRISQVARKLEEMPNTRARLQTGEITLENATSLVKAAAECGAGQVDGNRVLPAEAVAVTRMISASNPVGGPTLTAGTGARRSSGDSGGAGKPTCSGARTWKWES